MAAHSTRWIGYDSASGFARAWSSRCSEYGLGFERAAQVGWLRRCLFCFGSRFLLPSRCECHREGLGRAEANWAVHEESDNGRGPALMDETEFWRLVIREGLPRFRWFRRSIDIAKLDRRLSSRRDWLQLKAKLEPNDRLWPFELHVRNYLGLRRGFVALRSEEFVGGIVTEMS